MHIDGRVNQVVVFDYLDRAGYYAGLRGKRLLEELDTVKRNMQGFLDEERVLINGEDAGPRVIDVRLGFRGDRIHPYLLITIVFRGSLRRGLNVYENIYEETVAEYDYEVIWVFPDSMRVVDAELDVPYTVIDDGRVLLFRVARGTRIGGYERIVFSYK